MRGFDFLVKTSINFKTNDKKFFSINYNTVN